eukprot:m.42492 g.42492  ORF g.42492 m.42492 type:complete len:245 (+) comp17006_c0_seq2:42-776(+)
MALSTVAAWVRDIFTIFFPLLFYLIAVGVDDWSRTEASIVLSDTSGTVQIGLWRACADIDGDRLYSDNGDDCREGFCTARDQMAPLSEWDSHNLCDRSKASASFVLIGFICSLLVLWYSTIRRLRGIEEFLGCSTFYQFCSAICSCIAFGVWLAWQSDMNDDNGRKQGEVTFDELTASAGVSLIIVNFILTMIGFISFWCSQRASDKYETGGSAPRTSQRSQSQRPLSQPGDLELGGPPESSES